VLERARFEFVMGFRKPVDMGANCQPHAHASIEIVYHPTGAGITRLAGGGQIAFSPGTAIIYPPGQVHDQIASDPGEDICVQVGSTGELPSVLAHTLVVPRVDDACVTTELYALASGHPGASALRRMALSSRATAVLIELVQAASDVRPTENLGPGERYAVRAKEYILQHFRDIERIEEVARAQGISADYLRHVFQSYFGKSPVRWLVEVRIERAKELLLHSDLTNKAVADLCGFRDEHYFGTVFRKLEAKSPGEFRRRHG
jgi:AraC-like DNA-binding protein